MAVTKINGFEAPYRSQTFQKQAGSLVQARAVLRMDGTIVNVGGDVHIPPFTVIQNGLVITESSTRIRPLPDQEAPYYVAVSAATSAQIDDLVFSFPKSPEDISLNQVLLGYWDGVEWRKTPNISNSSLHEDAKQQNIDFNRVGPLSGLMTTVSGSNYSTTPGVLVDRYGLRQKLEEPFLTPIVATDVDFPRVDKIVYRRPNDDINRIGVRKFVVGGAHASTPIGVKQTQFMNDTQVNGQLKLLISISNSAVFISGRGYNTNQEIWFTRYSSDRTIEEIPPKKLIGELDTKEFDAVIDDTNDIHILFIKNGNLYYTKVDLNGDEVIPPTPVHVSGLIVSSISAAYHADSRSVFIASKVLVSPGNNKIFFQVVSGYSTTMTMPVPPKQVTHINGNLSSPSIFVTTDYDVYIACEDLTTKRVAYAKYNEVGDIIGSPSVVSSNTTRIGYPTPLVNNASKPIIHVADNKQLFVVFLQEYATFLNGISVWTGGQAYMQQLLSPSEAFTQFGLCVDDVLNALHLTVTGSTGTHYVKLEGQSVQFSYEISPLSSSYTSSCRDRFGAMLHLYASPLETGFTSYHTGTITAFGEAASIFGGAAVVSLSSLEMLLPAAMYTPRPGDKIVIAGSINGNDGTFNITDASLETFSAIDSHWRITVDNVFTTEYPTTALADLQAPTGNSVSFVKTNSELTSLAFRLNVLPTDLLLARSSVPGPVLLNYGDATVGPVPSPTDKLVLYGDETVIDWEQTLYGTVTISGGSLHVADLVNNIVYNLVNGSYPISEDQALFFYADPSNSDVTPQVTNISTIDWSQPVQVLGIIKQGRFVPHSLLASVGFEELDPGESNVVGEALPDLIRARLGILSDTQYQVYLNHHNFFPEDNYAIAISKLDAATSAIQNDTGGMDVYTVVEPLGITSYTTTKFTWLGDHDRTDIQVYQNGKLLVQSLDGSLNYDYHKGDIDRIEFHYTVPYKAQIVIRKERTGGGSSGFLKTYNNDTLVNQETQKINFTGPGVICSNGGGGKVNVHISGGSSYSVTLVKSFMNRSGGTLPAGTATAFDDDGGLVLSDTTSSSIADFAGIVVSDFANNAYGDVYKKGNCPGILAGLGALPGQLVYLGEIPGSLSLTPPSGVTDTILILGRAEPGNGQYPDGTADDLYLDPQLISGV